MSWIASESQKTTQSQDGEERRTRVTLRKNIGAGARALVRRSLSVCVGARIQERIICLHGPVTEQMSSLVTAQLLFLESEDPQKPINMYINRLEGGVTLSVCAALVYLPGYQGYVYTYLQLPVFSCEDSSQSSERC